MTAVVVLAVSLRAGDRIRTGHRWDVTSDMPPGVWSAWRRLVGQRRSGEHIQVAVVADGMPVGTWNGDTRWPRESADAIRQARIDIQETATA